MRPAMRLPAAPYIRTTDDVRVAIELAGKFKAPRDQRRGRSVVCHVRSLKHGVYPVEIDHETIDRLSMHQIAQLVLTKLKR